MSKDLMILVLTLLVLIWGFYKSYRKKNEGLFYALVLFGTLELPQRLLGWPVLISFGIWAVFGFSVLLYKIIYKNLDKNLLVFALVFLVFAIVFFTSILWEFPFIKLA